MSSSRMTAVRKTLDAKKAHALLVINREGSGQPGTRYLSGFSGSTSLLVIAPRETAIIADGRYHAQVRREAPSATLLEQTAAAPAFGLLEFFIAKHRIRSILIDDTRILHADVEKLRRLAPKVAVKSAPNFLAEMRTIKTTEEVAHIKKAAVIAGRAFARLKRHIRPGAIERSLAAKLELFMAEEGADGPAFETIVASGKNGALPHAKPTMKKIRAGELVTIDFGARYKGYCSDITRTVPVGKISGNLKDILDTVSRAQALGCRAARAGMTGAALDALCRDYIAGRGYGKYFVHGTGHGLGMEVHELPYVNASNRAALAPGMIVTCEPGIYKEGLGGARIEDDLLIAKTGAINLTRSVPS